MAIALYLITNAVLLASVCIMALIAGNVAASAHGVLNTRQFSSGLNFTGMSDSCQGECNAIDNNLTACGENSLCRCTEENAVLLVLCVDCAVAAYTNVNTSNPDMVQQAQSALSQFEIECENAMVPVSIPGTPTSTQTELPAATAETSPVHTPSTHRHTINKVAIISGVIGGVMLVILSIWFFIHRHPRRSLTTTRTKRPFYRLKEVDVGAPPPGLVQKV